MDKRWRKTRRMILNRDKGMCERCALAGRRSVAIDVVRIKTKAQGGGNHHSNLTSVCEGCRGGE